MATSNRKAYEKELKRIHNYMKRKEKEGYIFVTEYGEKLEYTLPKRVTAKALQEIQRTRASQLLAKAKIFTPSGDIISGTKAKSEEIKRKRAVTKIERKRKKTLEKIGLAPSVETTQPTVEKLPRMADNIIINFKSYVNSFPPAIRDKFLYLIDQIATQQTSDDLAYALNEVNIADYMERTTYGYQQNMNDFATALLDAIPDASDQWKADMMELFEYEETGYNIEE